MTKKLINLLALVLLGLFFLPFVLKVKEWDLIILLVAGMVLPAYDFLTSKTD